MSVVCGSCPGMGRAVLRNWVVRGPAEWEGPNGGKLSLSSSRDCIEQHPLVVAFPRGRCSRAQLSLKFLAHRSPPRTEGFFVL